MGLTLWHLFLGAWFSSCMIRTEENTNWYLFRYRRKMSLDILHYGKSMQPASLQNTLPLPPPCPPVRRKWCRPTGPENLPRWTVLSGEKPPPAVMISMEDVNKLWAETCFIPQDLLWPSHSLLSVLTLVSSWSQVQVVLAPLWHIRLLSCTASGALLFTLWLGCYCREWLPEIKLCQSIVLLA